ncbi:MAG TPA: RNA polymerase factor sigma-54 [Bacillota bacterium]
MKLTLQQEQKLQLVMTQQLRQAIEILQYSTYDLYQYIYEQALENPLIEIEESHDLPDSSSNSNSKVKGTTDDSETNPFDYIAGDEPNLQQQLMEQARLLRLSETDYKIVTTLIQHLDENGYLVLNTKEIALQMKTKDSAIENGLQLLQQLEPVGVGARSLQECLLLQLNYFYPREMIAKQIIHHYLHVLADRKWEIIADKMNISLAEVKHAYECIQTLHPKPGSLLSSTQSEYVYPDVLVKVANGKFTVSLNDRYLPRIRLNDHYLSFINQKTDESNYIRNRYTHYRWLMNSIEKRRSTILKITEAIIRKQEEFFFHGLSSLKPLTLKDIAHEVGMHESTVSRATMNKVIQTPTGSYDFRTLFSSKLASNNGKPLSQTKVKFWLQELIQKENKYKPFSDQKISDYFKANKGINISRRTIAKYRQELNIPPSTKRKEIQI